MSDGPDWMQGRAIIEREARTGRPFSLNDIRAEIRACGFGRFSTGNLLLQAQAAGVVRQYGAERSSDRPTHGKPVTRWIGTEHYRQPAETIPVQRDRAGRYVSHDGSRYADVPLFDVEGVSR